MGQPIMEHCDQILVLVSQQARRKRLKCNLAKVLDSFGWSLPRADLVAQEVHADVVQAVNDAAHGHSERLHGCHQLPRSAVLIV